ncbi:type II toxin-antitoxin system RelE/ParE family toxin [Tautonia sociabilis]|uniref:Toxin n=1 Tax=Tautonia sociabilis TaxID=2080755 RepID=A0A432MIF3_9BACT|nr:type II toxin-antitoxin system RelE/ParE family toxin [Tautonia sociabilis]RUL86978.1 type II toxin-antitoxin system RelE/ParE family toxin [Tautonia sociabilis]
MGRIVRSAAAERDLIEIWAYIAEDNLEAADRLLDKLNDTLQTLAEHPEMGRERPVLGPGLRSFPIESFVVFYREAAGGIEIVRVLHGRRDVEEQL